MSFPTKLGVLIHLVILLRPPELKKMHLGQVKIKVKLHYAQLKLKKMHLGQVKIKVKLHYAQLKSNSLQNISTVQCT